MKTILTSILLLMFPLCGHSQEKPVGLTYIDSIEISVHSTAEKLSLFECLPESQNDEIEISMINGTYFCIVKCKSNEKLFQYEYESKAWISIPLPSVKDDIKTTRKITSLFSKNGIIYVTLHFDGAEIKGNDDERPYVYEDKTFDLSYLQQYLRK